MKKVRCIMFPCMLLLCLLLLCPAKAQAASGKVLPKGKNVSIDLNGGANEKVRWKVSRSNETDTFLLYINGKRVAKVTPQNRAMITDAFVYDIDTRDKYKEIFVSWSGDESNWGVFVVRYYSASKTTVYKNFTGYTPFCYRRQRMETSLSKIKSNKKGTFYLEVETPFGSPSFGCYYILMPCKLVNGKIKGYSVSSYTLNGVKDYAQYYFGGNYYTLAGKAILYSDAACTRKKSTLKQGTKFVPKKVHVLSAIDVGYTTRYNLSVSVKTTNGKTGWIKFPNSVNNILTKIPTWG